MAAKKIYTGYDSPFYVLDEAPLNKDALLNHARDLALSHKLKVCKRTSSWYIPELKKDQELLELAYKKAHESVKEGWEPDSVAEWLIDNYYLLEEQLKQLLMNDKSKKSVQIPCMKGGFYDGYPRVFILTAELVSHMEARFNEETIIDFINAYQSISPLSMKELWLFPDMLVVALIKSAAGVAARTLSAYQMKTEARKTVELLTKKNKRDYRFHIFSPETKVLIKNSTYIKTLYTLLRDEPQNAQALSILDKRLKREDLIPEELIRQEHGKQAKNQSIIANAITSVRMLSHVAWEDVFEKLSVVNGILNHDEIYKKMDFESREYYRRTIESLAKNLHISETAVAKEALKLKDEATEEQKQHAGYYIAGEGREALCLELVDTLPIKLKIERYFKRHMLFYYSASVIAVAFTINFAVFLWMLHFLQNIWLSTIGAFFTYLPIYAFLHPVISKFFMRCTRPSFIPKMDYSEGVPVDYKTVTVVPAILNDEKSALTLLEDLEVYYTANLDENICFALLGDFKDADYPVNEEEQAIVNMVEARVEELNIKYGREVFYYLHRKRIFVPEEKKYVGEERKRGALFDFCALLKNEKKDGYLNNQIKVPKDIKYVLTLDADTQVPRDAAKKLIGAMSHPLNKPVLNEEGTRVAKGYALMQPRISIDVVSAAKSNFSLIFSGQAGLDTYSMAASDLYQDLFGEGIFTGKGIFDLDMYYTLLKGAFPKRSILSHDLLEGSYLRTALVSDVVLVDGFPSQYISYTKRQHRWLRGDWQLVNRLGKKVLNERREYIKNPLSSLSKYKMSDNLNRSLILPACFVVAFLGLTILHRSMTLLLIVSLLTLFYEPLSGFIGKNVALIKNANQGAVFKDAWFETRNMFRQSLFKLSVLPYETFLNTDAIVRTLYRVYISRKKMLEWVTAAEHENKKQSMQAGYWKKMIISPILGIAVILLSAFFVRGIPYAALVIGTLWFFSPSIAYFTSTPVKKKHYEADEHTIGKLRLLARKTWRFFDEYCTDDTSMWAPDNVQEYPNKKPVDRTSSTNIAFSIIANVIARDLGYVTMSEMIERMEKCIAGIEKCDKWHGHMYNWYHTGTLHPLRPEYVSSVDSGNLACYLLAACEGIEDAIYKPIYANCGNGLIDTLSMETKKNGHTVPLEIQNLPSALSFYQMLMECRDKNHYPQSFSKAVESFLKEAERFAPFLLLLEQIPAERNGISQAALENLVSLLNDYSPGLFADRYHEILSLLSQIYKQAAKSKNVPMVEWAKKMEILLGTAYINTKRLIRRSIKLITRMKTIFNEMDFSKLYDEKKGLFSIGFNVKEGVLSNSYYDLLASEARQAGFIAIAKGDIPQKHWFRLSRPLAVLNERRVLLSWGGTMFEYFMPLLLMKNYEYTLLDETYHAVVEAQKMYGDKKHVPWGVSESGYYAFDLNMYYQYKAFGVQKLGLKSGLSKDTVISPYSTCMALMINPMLAIKNIEELKKIGLLGKYGFYEAIDYTHERTHGKDKKHIVKSYMAHHQGMILAALSNYLSDNYIQRLFHSAPIVKATELLLKEKIPARNVVIKEYEHQVQEEENPVFKEIRALRKFSLNTSLYPETHMLSNGRYTCVLTQFGNGYSTINGILLNRWSNDFMREFSGVYVYVSEENSDMVWSSAFFPSGIEPEDYQVSFDAHKAEFTRTDRGIKTVTEVCISPEADLEIRRITLTNDSNEARRIRLTCAVEPVLAEYREFIAHPAFAEFFLESKVYADYKAVSAKRRMRKPDDKPYGLVLKAVCDDMPVTYGTNRESFFGRQNSNGIPAAITGEKSGPGNGTEMTLVLDVMVHIPKGEKKTVSFVLSAGENEGEALTHALNISDDMQVLRVMDLAWTHSQVEMRYLGLKHTQANVYQMIASRMIMHTPVKANFYDYMKSNRLHLQELWRYGISGDVPILLFMIHKIEDLKRVREILLAHEFWRMKGFKADLVMLNQSANDYLNPVRDKLHELVQLSHARDIMNMPGGVFILEADHVGDAVSLLITAASVVLKAEQPFMQQILFEENIYPHKLFTEKRSKVSIKRKNRRYHILENGLGGFIQGGKEYRIILKEDMDTPAPWSNILTNKEFGSVITMEGGGYTWMENSRMMRITPFRNDGLKDIAGEGILLRDDGNGDAFSLLPGMLQTGEYEVTFGRGYGIYERHGGINTRLTIFTDFERNVKASICEIENTFNVEKNISLYYFMEPVLGDYKESHERNVVVQMVENGALCATNAFSYVQGMAYIYAPAKEIFYTSLKEEFFGHFGSVYKLNALNTDTLSNRTGPGAPCLAIQVKLLLKPNERIQLPFLLGFARNTEELRRDVLVFDTADKAFERYEYTKRKWEDRLDSISVRTPGKRFDILINHWVLYQIYASRLIARTGYFQSGGAYGFRDQLQDILSLLYFDEKTAKEHILRSATKQFVEGDVLHWWHEKSKGVRTFFKDDLLFLPYTACIYTKVTGDYSVFNETVPYLKSVEIPAGQDDLYMEFEESEVQETLYMHCVRAIERSLAVGEHGLAKIGGGDWCDGMNYVGLKDKGESVWLSFFLFDVLNKFQDICLTCNDMDRKEKYAKAAEKLCENISENAWDGKWYKRAFYDDGTPIGSAECEECSIDILPQAWAAITNCGSKQRQIEAYNSVMQRLLKREDALICLFQPAFDKTEKYPGYIKGYRPGMRENGGQYTHACAWHIMAAAALKRKDEAFDLFSLLSPANHTSTSAGLIKYRGEPYVYPGDVSYAEGIRGRAGWTWYTGSASWMYIAAMQSILGFYKEAEKIHIEPCIPEGWHDYDINYKYKNTRYVFHIVNPYGNYSGKAKLTEDGLYIGEYLHLQDDGGVHHIKAELLP